VNWFPTRAEVTPGVGGRWLVSWDGNWPWNTDIEIWEPNRHLRLVDRVARPFDVTGTSANASVAPLPIAIDWYLDAKGGSTTLRLVHSGFGRGAEWDDEVEGVSTGWPQELNSLKLYLERHRGERRRVVWNRTAVPVPVSVLWPRLVGPDGVTRDGTLATLRPGDRYETTLATGDRISGTVIMSVPNRGLQVTIDGWNGALYRVWVDRVGEESSVNSWLSTYGVLEPVVKEFEARMRVQIERVASAAVVA
jgi:Activator of Hsp90 ATPase homolog 1-like protein